MARRRPPDRLDKILEAAKLVFGKKGLARTKMSDVAEAAGVSQGTLYNYVESKEALFRLLLDHGLGMESPPHPSVFPVPSPPVGDLAARMRQTVCKAFALPKLDAAIRRRKVDDAGAELAEVVGELYDKTLETRAGAEVLEKSALDVPELAAVFYGEVRAGLLRRLAELVRKRTASKLYHPYEPIVAARVILEAITFAARHRFRDVAPMVADEAVIRTTVVRMLVRTLLKKPPTFS
jgi:AcrR family transcriptional regulator